jgi:hypothetical protein
VVEGRKRLLTFGFYSAYPWVMNGIAVGQLRETLAERFPDAQPLVYRTAAAVSTGVEALDRLLPNTGFPRGQLTAWQPGGGATAVLRAACVSTIGRGERAAWVDAGGQVLGDDWPDGPLLIRPTGMSEALECAEELARCGGFGLVVVGRGPGEVPVRLGRAVREGGGALVVVSPDLSQARLRIESRLAAEDWHWRQGPFGEPSEIESAMVEVSARTLGWSGRTRFRMPVLTYRSRLALDPLLVDRRGAPRRAVWPGGKAPPSPSSISSNTLSKSHKILNKNKIDRQQRVSSRPTRRVS